MHHEIRSGSESLRMNKTKKKKKEKRFFWFCWYSGGTDLYIGLDSNKLRDFERIYPLFMRVLFVFFFFFVFFFRPFIFSPSQPSCFSVYSFMMIMITTMYHYYSNITSIVKRVSSMLRDLLFRSFSFCHLMISIYYSDFVLFPSCDIITFIF